MRFKLMPRDDGFYPLFREAAGNAVGCCEVLRELVTRPADSGSLVGKLVECEHHGDELVRAMKQRLDTTVVTPFDREDILTLAEGLDHAVDDIRAAGEFIHLHHISEPLEGVVDMADVLHDTAEAMVRLMENLPRMRGLQTELDAVDQLESKGDDVYRRTVARLFSGKYKAFTVLRWKDVIESMEHALNAFEEASETVAEIAVKHA
jgi:predicted phosphate transport protein (TIGR00153 family)